LRRGRPKVSHTMGMVATVPLLAIPTLVEVANLRLINTLGDAKIVFAVREATVLP